jgi:hypothetical protein
VHNCRELKNACMNFITVVENWYCVMLTEEFLFAQENRWNRQLIYSLRSQLLCNNSIIFELKILS